MTAHPKTFQATIAKGLMAALLLAQMGLIGSIAFYGAQAWAQETYNTADGLPPCPDTTLGEGLSGATQSASSNALQQTRQFFGDQLRQDAMNPKKNLRGKIFDTYCLSMYYDFYDLIQGLIGYATIIYMAIKAAIDALLNYVCEYVNAAAENVLNAFCLPLPKINLSLDLPAIKGSSCDGVSLADLIKVGPGTPLTTLNPLPSNFLSAPMSRWLGSTSGSGRF